MTFTAKQIADALGIKRQAVQWHLRSSEADGVQVVNGNEAAAWSVDVLPPALRGRLEAEASHQNCRTVADFINRPRRKYQPAIPLDQVCESDIQVATNLRTALLPWLFRQHDTRLTSVEMDAAGVEDYRRIFGTAITARYWRELFVRTVQRDNGFEDWNRLEIYLPERLKEKIAPAAVVSEALADDFAELESFIASCTNPHAPTQVECSGIWTLAVEKYASLVRGSVMEKQAARRVRAFLIAKASFLAASREALWIAWKRKLEVLKTAGGDVKARRDAPEALRKQMAEVQARKVHPSKYFYSLDQWNRRIGQLVDQYNSEPQQGHILAGLSPDAAFEKYMNRENPPMQFTAGLRYLLAHDKRQAQVTTNGVTIQVGKTKFNYRGAEIAHLIGREVLAWFDPENPETVVITNLDRTNPICVARSENPNALESLIAPESGTLARELARVEGQASHMKTRFTVVKAKFALPQRQLLASAQTVELGCEIAVQKSNLAEKTTIQKRQRGQARQLAQSTGIAVPERAQENLKPEDTRFLAYFLNGKETQ